MKKPQSISLLGNALFTGAQESSAKRRSDDKKDRRKKKVLKYLFRGAESIGNAVLNRKNDQFLKDENFFVRDALVSTNIAENKRNLADWNNSQAYEGGQDSYFLAKANAKMQNIPMVSNWGNKANKEQYDSYKHTFASELAGTMKANSKSNYEEATSLAAKWGENPREAFKTKVMQRRARNMDDAIILPFVNFFAGNDERNDDEMAIDSVNSETGLASQDKVDSKVFKTIYEKTGNYKTALSSAQDLKEFKTRFNEGASKLKKADPIFGDVHTIKIPNPLTGTSDEISVRDIVTSDGRIIDTFDMATGKSRLNSDQNKVATVNAQTVDKKIVDNMEVVHRDNITPQDEEMLKSYKENWMRTDEPTDELINLFNQDWYGGVAITKNTLDETYGGFAGWSGAFSSRLAINMHMENLKLGYTKGTWGSDDSFDANRSLLVGSDQFSSLLAAKSVLAMRDSEDIGDRILSVSLVNEMITNGNEEDLDALSVGQYNIANELLIELQDKVKLLQSGKKKIKTKSSERPDSEKKIMESLNNLMGKISDRSKASRETNRIQRIAYNDMSREERNTHRKTDVYPKRIQDKIDNGTI